MVKHGKNKKRRAGRIGKTKLKNRNFRFYKPPQITDTVMKEHWDPRKSPSINMANLGLKSNLGEKAACQSTITSLESSSSCKAIELFDIPDSDAFPKKSSDPGRLPVSIENQKYIVELLNKYGNNYTSMARDIKLNNMQHNENQLRKIGARFLLLNENQIRVEIPDSVRALMACFSK